MYNIFSISISETFTLTSTHTIRIAIREEKKFFNFSTPISLKMDKVRY